jgi:hypothetical protein
MRSSMGKSEEKGKEIDRVIALYKEVSDSIGRKNNRKLE